MEQEFESILEAYPVRLDNFEGPLDLLLHLIRKNEVNIYDIPISLITEQYLGFIELMQELQLELAGEYLVMAATLAEIKSRMLLPRPKLDEDGELDPRAELVRRLQEYERFKRAAEGIDDMDASVLLLPELGLIEAQDPRFASTVAAIEQDLVRGRHVMRYAAEDDFGLPETEFLVCRFWLIDALAALGRREEARERYQDALLLRNSYGLLAEDIHPETGALWGNFPQTYSMAGLILSAMRLSQSWEDRYWRASS